MKAKVKQRNGRYPKKRKQNWIPIALLAVGVILVGVALLSYTNGTSTVGASSDYHPDEVAYDQPIVAVHEMGEGPTIPFLHQDQPQPDIVLPETNFNFGLIGAKDVVEQTFIVRNEGDAPLTISRAYTTCGCTTAEISASVIPPGKLATVRIIFDAGFHDAAGQTVRRGVILENNDPMQPQAEIWVQASVKNN